jgi:hypothetical protein
MEISSCNGQLSFIDKFSYTRAGKLSPENRKSVLYLQDQVGEMLFPCAFEHKTAGEIYELKTTKTLGRRNGNCRQS